MEERKYWISRGSLSARKCGNHECGTNVQTVYLWDCWNLLNYPICTGFDSMLKSNTHILSQDRQQELRERQPGLKQRLHPWKLIIQGTVHSMTQV